MFLKNLLILFLFLFSANQVWAWGNEGHSIVGYIAEKQLSPATQAMLKDIIGLEPMPVTAIWADLVREDGRFKKFAPYHFFEIPEGATAGTLSEAQLADRDAHTVIEQAPDKILSAKVSREEKIIWLRYLVHVIGDVHQPLHVGNGIDMGANLCEVKWQRPGSQRLENTSLHSLWDTKLLGAMSDEYSKALPTKRYLDTGDVAGAIVKEFEKLITMESANKVTANAWYDEARSYHKKVYPDAKSGISPEDRPYCRIVDKTTNKVVDGKFSESRIPILKDVYTKASLPIIKRQLLLAGLRLAGTLNNISAKYAPSLAKPETIDFDISQVGLWNKPARTPQNEEKFVWRQQLPYPHDCH